MSGATSKADDWRTRQVLQVRIKPNAVTSQILGWDATTKTLAVAIAAPPVDNKANIALLKLLKQETGRDAQLKTGATGKTKLITFL